MSDQKATHLTAAGKVRLRKDGNRWQVTFPCDYLRPTENIAGVSV